MRLKIAFMMLACSSAPVFAVEVHNIQEDAGHMRNLCKNFRAELDKAFAFVLGLVQPDEIDENGNLSDPVRSGTRSVLIGAGENAGAVVRMRRFIKKNAAGTITSELPDTRTDFRQLIENAKRNSSTGISSYITEAGNLLEDFDSGDAQDRIGIVEGATTSAMDNFFRFLDLFLDRGGNNVVAPVRDLLERLHLRGQYSEEDNQDVRQTIMEGMLHLRPAAREQDLQPEWGRALNEVPMIAKLCAARKLIRQHSRDQAPE